MRASSHGAGFEPDLRGAADMREPPSSGAEEGGPGSFAEASKGLCVCITPSAQSGQRLVVQQGVGGQRAAPVRAVGAGEVGEPAAGLAHQDVEGCEIP
ncbi:hypothetical protein MLGJGCBP_01783 [Rhodococcus sp. T7]|nr:hypothetical protein MLGJGCBP_01783 [Rhodococcus sp. T7]